MTTTAFSVYVNIGGKLNPTLAGAVAGAKNQLRGLETVTTGIGARIAAPFIAAQKTIAATTKHLERVQRAGSRMAMTVTAPAVYGASRMLRSAVDRDKAENNLEALGGISHAERREVSAFADGIASKYGRATSILETFNSMLKAGFNVPAAKGSIPAVLEGAIVADGEMSAPELANSVSKIVTQYGLNMKSVEGASASSRRIVDNLIFGANSTAASVKEMTDAYKFVGAAASAAGESIESTNALIISLSKAGQMGSEAGVALRSAYVRLLKPTKEGQATMARLGLDYGNYVSGGKRTGAGVSRGLGAFGFDVPASALDKALARGKGSNEKQRKAVFDTVIARLGADQAKDIEAVGKAVDGALTLAGGKTNLTKLMIDLKKAGASQGDLARLFEGRQSVRMLSLMNADIEGISKDVNEGAVGYSEKVVAKRQQGLEGAMRRLDAAWSTFSNTLVKAVTPEIVGMMERLAGAVKNLSATSPATLKIGIGLTAAAAAAGPLMFVLGAVGRIGALALTGLLTPIAMAARGLVGLGVAMTGLAVAGAARLSAMLIGFRMLATFGAGATLAAMGASLGRLALAPFAMIGAGLRGIAVGMWALVANPVGIALTAIVGGLAALGLWVANNWSGIKTFFSAFGTSFMEGLGGANGPLGTMVGYLSSAYDWISKLLGPLDESGTKWRSWGEAVGGAAASGINAVVSAIQKLIGFFQSAYDGAVKLGGAVKNMLGFGGGATAAPAVAATPAPALAGKRALGGPVLRARPYLVGERGPELFVPGMSGRIETNDRLRRLTADGTAAVAGSTSTTNRGPVTFSPTFNITGGDPREVAGQIRSEMHRFLAELEAEQRGFLSD